MRISNVLTSFPFWQLLQWRNYQGNFYSHRFVHRKEKLKTKPNDKTCMLVTYFSTLTPPPPNPPHTHKHSWFHTCSQHKGCNKATTDNMHLAQLLPFDSLQMVYLPSDFPLAISSSGLLTQLPPFDSLLKWSTCPVTSLW